MAQIDRIVGVSVTRESQQIEISSFNIPLILVEVDKTTLPDVPRVGTYTTLSSVAEAFSTDHPAYTISEKLLSGDIQPAEWRIGIVETTQENGDTVTESYIDAINAVALLDDNWYALLSDADTVSDVLDLASYIQARSKMYFTSSQMGDILDPLNSSDLGSLLKQRNYSRTALMYSPTALIDFPEASWVGTQLVEQAGSNSWEYKRLYGVATANLTDSDITVLESKNVNYYIPIKGAPVTRRGVSADTSWIDEIIFSDWLQARIQEQVYYRLINRKKIPYTRAGFTLVENEIRSVLAQGVAVGGISPDVPYTVVSPDPVTMPAMERARRNAATFQFVARLAGAISTVEIRGIVEV